MYFAYGSNMHSERMRSRIGVARALGAARLPSMRLVCNKLGRDGSAKANLAPDPEASVWGVLWSFPEAEWANLDRAEGGYRRIDVTVEWSGRLVPAQTYVSARLTDDGRLGVEYKRWLIEGARQHGLPCAYRRLLEELHTH